MKASDLQKLNAAAQSLFGEADIADNSEMKSSYIDELQQLNNWRKSILEFAFHIATALERYSISEAAIKNRENIASLIDHINHFKEIPTHGGSGKVMIRHRGLAPASKNMKSEFYLNNDYVISVGDCVIDNQQLNFLLKFGIMDAGELGMKLKKTFQFFHQAKLYSLEIFYREGSEKDKQLLSDALHCWGRYFAGNIKGEAVILDGEKTSSPNLTLLAAINKLNPSKFQGMTDKVHRLMRHEKSREKFTTANSIYDAIFLIDDLKSKFTRSPIEINNHQYIRMWRQCFDESGRFNRARFNQQRRFFLNWPEAFYIFWIDLKSVAVEEDRNTILNCIVRFIAESKSLDEYVDYILKDFYYYPLHLHFSDRESLFMANLLLFKNYVNITHDFGRTPGEVLFSEDPLNEELVFRLRAKINTELIDKFTQKILTLKNHLKSSLAADAETGNLMPMPFLINVMREVFIFLTLAWDKDFKPIVRDTVREYSNPESYLYHSKNSPEVMLPLLQFFQITILCLVKLGDERDIDLLTEIRNREKEFLNIKAAAGTDASLYKQLVGKIMSVVDEQVVFLANIAAP